MVGAIEEQRKIYVAYKSIFSGSESRIRTSKAIRQRVLANKELLKQVMGKGKKQTISKAAAKTVNVLKFLLESQVFQSETIAREVLPQLFVTTSEQRRLRREAKEAEEARSEAEALRPVAVEAEVLHPVASEEEVKEADQTTDQRDAEIRSEHEEDVQEQADSQQARTGSSLIPALYPIQTPFLLQHRILCITQKLLEKCCFDFTRSHHPEILKAENWDCEERVELHCWTTIYRKRFTQAQLAATQVDQRGVTLRQLLTSVDHIRDAAVHRQCLSSAELIRTIEDGIVFAEILGFPERTELLHELWEEMESTFKSQEIYKSFLKVKLARDLDEIGNLRAALDRRQQNAIQAMLVENEENDKFVNLVLKLSLEELLSEDRAMTDVSEDSPEVPGGIGQDAMASDVQCNGN